jgi:large subunit ribosomal protein L7/L12
MADDKGKASEDAKEEKKEESKDVSKNVAKIVDLVSELTVLELSELVDALQDKLGVSAMPVAAAAPTSNVAGAAGEGEAASDAAGGGTLVMTAAGDQKIAVIKALREVNQNWGLKEAKDMTENLPAEILTDAKPEEVKDAAEKLKAAGATVEVK